MTGSGGWPRSATTRVRRCWTPSRHPCGPSADLDTPLRAMADFADLKSPWFRGHSPGVAELAVAAGMAAGMPAEDATLLGRAALVHDVGQVGIAAGIWDHPGRLSAEQWERVRLHPYLSERVLRRCRPLAPLADLAAGHHERADGSGYHRGIAETWSRSWTARRRRRLPRDDRGPATSAVSRPCGSGSAIVAPTRTTAASDMSRSTPCCEVAGETRRPARHANPAGLTDREVEVLLPDRPRSRQQAGGHDARHLPEDGGPTRRAHLRQGRGRPRVPGRRCSRWSRGS